jgi:hypothetical protein
MNRHVFGLQRCDVPCYCQLQLTWWPASIAVPFAATLNHHSLEDRDVDMQNDG